MHASISDFDRLTVEYPVADAVSTCVGQQQKTGGGGGECTRGKT